MYKIYGIATQNTLKTLYVAEEIGIDYEFRKMDLGKGEQKEPSFLKINPVGKVPALQHDTFHIFESGAIVRYLANVEKSTLYPQDPQMRAKVDQWLDFFSHHLGRWLSTLYFQKVIKKFMNMGNPDAKMCEEAESFSHQFMNVVENHLSQNNNFCEEALTIADLCAYAYMEQVSDVEFDMASFPTVTSWLESVASRPSILSAKRKLSSHK